MPTTPSPPPSRPRSHLGRWVGLVMCLALVASVYAVYSGAITVPERFNPWSPLDVAAEPNLLTTYKLSRARGSPDLCLAALAQTSLKYDLLPDRETGAGCGFKNAVRLRTAPLRFGAPLPLSCPMALSFAMWERHALQAAAQIRFGERVVAIDNLGSYACRNINSGKSPSPEGAGPSGSGNRSQHATANALDISGFTLANGKHITVLKDFQLKDGAASADPEALLLDDIHAGACKYFKGVLGPNYNAAHRDHFHFETGSYGMCR